jgi:hypothetical protein
MKMDESIVDETVLREKPQENLKNDKIAVKSDKTIQIGSFRKRKKSTSSESKFL